MYILISEKSFIVKAVSSKICRINIFPCILNKELCKASNLVLTGVRLPDQYMKYYQFQDISKLEVPTI